MDGEYCDLNGRHDLKPLAEKLGVSQQAILGRDTFSLRKCLEHVVIDKFENVAHIFHNVGTFRKS